MIATPPLPPGLLSLKESALALRKIHAAQESLRKAVGLAQAADHWEDLLRLASSDLDPDLFPFVEQLRPLADFSEQTVRYLLTINIPGHYRIFAAYNVSFGVWRRGLIDSCLWRVLGPDGPGTLHAELGEALLAAEIPEKDLTIPF